MASPVMLFSLLSNDMKPLLTLSKIDADTQEPIPNTVLTVKAQRSAIRAGLNQLKSGFFGVGEHKLSGVIGFQVDNALPCSPSPRSTRTPRSPSPTPS